MIVCGAQIRAARGFLGWSQADLAEAAGLHVNAVRYYEAQHGRELHYLTGTGYGCDRITNAFREAGLEMQNDPPGVMINPHLYEGDKRPPLYERWEKHYKPDSKPAKERARLERIAQHQAEVRRELAGGARINNQEKSNAARR
jgi:transcriptional regulator with XRE-family HTH domain